MLDESEMLKGGNDWNEAVIFEKQLAVSFRPPILAGIPRVTNWRAHQVGKIQVEQDGLACVFDSRPIVWGVWFFNFFMIYDELDSDLLTSTLLRGAGFKP